jgi:DNA-binding winged helix-turn-helix (wHTH) protein
VDALTGSTAANRRQGRRWLFASAVLDERSWTLTVDGGRIPVSTKPLELLHTLLLRAGEVVTKDELLDAVWPNVSVVEGSIPTAVLKLRRALKDDGSIIETVSGIGYRFAVPVEVESAPAAPELEAAPARTPAMTAAPPRAAAPRRRRWLLAAGGLLATLALVAGTVLLTRLLAPAPAPRITEAQAASALRRLDVPEIEAMLAAGWDPNAPFNEVGDGALNQLLAICEWNPAHDRQRLVLAVRTLLDGGARLDARNGYGDTAYSIAAAPRYCGPDHPVTRMLRTLCYAGAHPVGDRCLADYAGARAARGRR